jgi:hypothetical protein
MTFVRDLSWQGPVTDSPQAPISDAVMSPIAEEVVNSIVRSERYSFDSDVVDHKLFETIIGAGGGITQGSGTLTIASGTTAGSITTVQSRQSFLLPARLAVGISLSARQANQEFEIAFVGVDADNRVNDRDILAWVWDGTTVTNAEYRVGQGAVAPIDSAAVTVPTSASAALFEIDAMGNYASFHAHVLDSATGRSNSYRRDQRMPNPNARYKLRMRWRNIAAPAASANALITFVHVEAFRRLLTEIVAGNNPVPVALPGNTGGVNSLFMQGQTNRGNTVAGAPVRVGANGVSTMPANLTSGQQANMVASLDEKLIVQQYAIPDLFWSFVGAVTGLTVGSDTAARAAGAAPAGRNYVTSCTVQNNSATAGEFQIKDGATVLWRIWCPANMAPTNFRFPVPLRGSNATALNVQAVTASSVIIASLQGYQGY